MSNQENTLANETACIYKRNIQKEMKNEKLT